MPLAAEERLRKKRIRNKRWYDGHKGEINNARRRAYRKHHLKQYGLTPERYQEMVQAQQGLCASCKQPPRGKRPVLYVDHDHKTGRVRGLLCNTCNTAFGLLREDPSIIQLLVEYAVRHG